MLKKIENKNMGSSNIGWLNSKFHFSFADYYNPNNTNFGVLRVLNDDLVNANAGFDTHPHKDMEIISYIVEGELTHANSMGHKNTITRGHVQYISAGTGVYHSEYNYGKETARLLQIWIFPDKKGYTPTYGDYQFKWEARQNKWLHMVSNKMGSAPITINQDVNIYATNLEKENTINFPVPSGRQAYLVQIEGTSAINEVVLHSGDAMEIVEEDILVKANELSHCLILEMKKQD